MGDLGWVLHYLCQSHKIYYMTLIIITLQKSTLKTISYYIEHTCALSICQSGSIFFVSRAHKTCKVNQQ